MFTWLTKFLTKNIHPILEQAYRVIAAVPISFDGVLQQLTDFGITSDSPAYKTLVIIKDVIVVLQDAIGKILTALGGQIPAATASTDLEEELKKLKNLL